MFEQKNQYEFTKTVIKKLENVGDKKCLIKN